MRTSVKETFEQRLATFTQQAEKLKSEYNTLSWVRVGLFIAAAVLLVMFAQSGDSAAVLAIAAVSTIVFLVLLRKHSLMKTEVKIAEAKQDINSDELKRLNNDFKDLSEGMNHYQANHPYHEDLDIYGKHSLFQLLNRTSTQEGEQCLVHWLDERADNSEINSRQGAVKELADKLEFRQDFEAYGRAHEAVNHDTKGFLNWLDKEDSSSNLGLLKLALVLMPAITIGSIILSSMGYLQSGLPILLCFVNIGILGTVFNRLLQMSKETEKGYKALGALKDQIKLIEQESFSNERLKNLQTMVVSKSGKASDSIKSLHNILDNLQNRVNLMYFIFNVLLLLDIFWFLKVLNWKKKNSEDIAKWFSTVGEFEALNSLAGFAFSNPEYSFPELTDKPFLIDAKQLGHPLINPEKRVSNDFNFVGQGGVCLVTGSNMSGKSTFLRTVGVNCVLALMGAPVCANQMTLGQLMVFTSMRNQDDLEENVSSFYAELRRLKQLLQHVDGETPVLFMIDEVLKGTNSEDRHKGALALIRQLNQRYAFGFVSTHDIVLGNITNELSGVKNYSFNSEITGDEIHFDYKLTEGICKSFNATKLMQKMGIEITS